jgi:hypothetical protein
VRPVAFPHAPLPPPPPACYVRKAGRRWLCSNCWHKETGEPLAGAKEQCVIQHEGYTIGLVGLDEGGAVFLLCHLLSLYGFSIQNRTV